MKKIIIFLIIFYQSFPRRKKCRFEPTCSLYVKTAIERFGILKGGVMALRRISKCHPGTPLSYDPVPVDITHKEL